MNELADRLAAIDPKRLVALMGMAGFVQAGEEAGVHATFRWPHAAEPREPSVIVPLDQGAPDYLDKLTAALRLLGDAVQAGDMARAVLDAFGGPLPKPSS
ncbi:hypothetical protein [Micromonospora deserti]|uniref:Uncharacterized protein n=1 Tax=Micromonospora deserti TaxID=2070366 RepID=A0A2W2DCX0_9ACTN|nr:hypothetical protein [Micromonospora deserti]PZG01739.1 hypothetical protein C1I99_05705 [Micromonospora deserti]